MPFFYVDHGASASSTGLADATSRRKFARLIFQDTALNVCGRLKLASLCRNESSERSNDFKVDSNVIKKGLLQELQKGNVSLCAVFCRKYPGILNKHFFAAYFVSYEASKEMELIGQLVELTLSNIGQEQHLPLRGMWITLDGVVTSDDLLAIAAPAELPLDDVDRQIDRFNETDNLENAPAINCMMDMKGTPEYQLQWIGSVSEQHKDNLRLQFKDATIEVFENDEIGLSQLPAKATPTAEYKFYRNNCGTALKFLMGVNRKSIAGMTCDKMGFYNIKGNLLRAAGEIPTNDTYIEILESLAKTSETRNYQSVYDETTPLLSVNNADENETDEEAEA